MLRILDTTLALIGLVVALPVLLVLALIGFVETGSPFFRQERVGRHGCSFVLIKFRTMRVGTASVASHLVSASSITPFGRFLRRSKLDELPQLWNVLKGEMSLVGPRPCLFNQEDLISARRSLGVLSYRPGITGLAQIRGIDMSEPKRLAKIDAHMMDNLTVRLYLKYLLLTVLGNGRGDRVL